MSAQAAKSTKRAPAGELVITRTFDAPRETVWRYFTEPDLMKKWWGPRGYTAPQVRTDLRVGGELVVCMRSPEGRDIWSKGVYKELVPKERIVSTDSFADEKSNVVPATYYGMNADFPLELQISMKFEEHEGKTRFTLRHSGFPAAADRDGARTGWGQSFDKLEEVLRR